MLNFNRIHDGYFFSTDNESDYEYTIRTRPLDDGYMIICDGYVVGTGFQRFIDAKKVCEGIEKAAVERHRAGDFSELDQLCL